MTSFFVSEGGFAVFRIRRSQNASGDLRLEASGIRPHFDALTKISEAIGRVVFKLTEGDGD